MAFLIKNWAHRAVSILGVIGLLGAAVARADETILVLKSRNLSPYETAVKGFIRQWKVYDSPAKVRVQTLDDSSVTSDKLFGAGGPPIAVVAVGTDAARWAIKNTSGPVVFCMVANAQQNVLEGLDAAAVTRVTGVTLDIPAKTQLSELKTVLPWVKRVGVLYDPRKSGAAVTEAAQAASELGLELVTQEVAAESSLPEATGSIAPRIDLLWAPVDSTVFNSRSTQFVLTEMLKRRVPVMGFSENMVKAGALLAPRVSYAAIGEQTADLLQAVLVGARPKHRPVQSPQIFDVVVNARVLRLVDKPMPESSIHKVSMFDEP
jgi:putative tryptophan/tyrosine transport system substrate-binding protein